MKIEISYGRGFIGHHTVIYFETSKGTLYEHKIVFWLGRHRIIEAEYK